MTRSDAATVAECLERHAESMPEATGYLFLANGEAEETRWTFADMHCRAQAVAGHLRFQGLPPGAPVALMFQPGLPFLAGFFGCLYAGMIAVPVYPPKRPVELPLVASILAASAAEALLVDTATARVLGGLAGEEALSRKWHVIEEILGTDGGETWRAVYARPRFRPEDIAFLQFTSGSTENPKGVAVSHANILDNQRVIRDGFGHGEHTTVVGWLPVYHDMGLVGNVIQPLFLGRPCILMPPAAFIQKPVRWLDAIGRYGATTSGGPNFAYDLCVNNITEAQIERLGGLRLESWQVAFTGAEPIRAETLDQFEARFAPRGFQRRAFYPCYGMSETTLMLTGVEAQTEPRVIGLDPEALRRGTVVAGSSADKPVKRVVSCGLPRNGNRVVIVDPETRRQLPDGRVGEIWTQGGSVAQGYWGNEAATAAQFRARSPDFPGMHFLRTGDLGFLHDGELYVTGRLKSLIIVNGKNHYPHDIEETVRALHPAFRPQAAAFEEEGEEGPRVVLVQEVFTHLAEKIDAEDLRALIRKAVAGRHGVMLHDVVLTTSRIPLTTSGKVRRAACREAWRAGELSIIAATRGAALGKGI